MFLLQIPVAVTSDPSQFYSTIYLELVKLSRYHYHYHHMYQELAKRFEVN